ncbi:hypothetical protein [Campylobacter rectus]|nr:hypothetical protein [Campylobacter rectus]UEB48067.1 hypothetical protein LK437_01700 [Campylobacter rectus]
MKACGFWTVFFSRVTAPFKTSLASTLTSLNLSAASIPKAAKIAVKGAK